MVKILLRYIIPIVLAVIAFYNYSYESDFTFNIENQAKILTPKKYYQSIESPISYSHLNLPRQISGGNNTCIQHTSHRANNLYKSNFRFVKCGKEINATIRNFIQKETVNIHYTFIKPVSRLIGLGKLII